MNQAGTIVLNFFFNLPAFLIALVAHEYAHGYVAYRLGDNTAKDMGRLTLNPLAHIDPFGTIILPLLLILSRAPFVVGWAKPVPVNFFNLKSPKHHMMLVGIAGPAANFIMGGLLYLLLLSGLVQNVSAVDFIFRVLLINIILGVFNLIPVPPLDGSRILMGLLPDKLAIRYARLNPVIGIAILLVILTLIRNYF